MLRLRSQPATEGHLGLVMPWQEMREAQPKNRPKPHAALIDGEAYKAARA